MQFVEEMDYISHIRRPIENEIADFIERFNLALTHDEGLLGQALSHIKSRAGKRMRPMLVLLTAKNYGQVSDVTLNGALGLELLHTASLVHDDVVDQSNERRGQASLNESYGNKVAVLVGDYILSTALHFISLTDRGDIVRKLAELGRTLSDGEILQLSNIQRDNISEEVYYSVISQKTAALFAACAEVGAMSVNATPQQVEEAKLFGQQLGMIFQIKDDIFDYFEEGEIGKPTGNDMVEGKLTLPAIYALTSTGNQDMIAIAKKVKNKEARIDEIADLVHFTKQNGGIAYAERKMEELRDEALSFVNRQQSDDSIKEALRSYVDFVIQRTL